VEKFDFFFIFNMPLYFRS